MVDNEASDKDANMDPDTPNARERTMQSKAIANQDIDYAAKDTKRGYRPRRTSLLQSTNSLSSLEKAVSIFHAEDQESASTGISTSLPSSDSSGEYRRTKSVHKTVLLVMRFLALCYSHFYGSERPAIRIRRCSWTWMSCGGRLGS